MKQTIDQLRCAMLAHLALKPYADRDDIESAISDLLADLRHLCDAKDLDFATLDRRAYQNYVAERRAK